VNKLVFLLVFIFAVTMLVACGTAPETNTSSEPQIKVMEPWSRPSPMKAGNGAVYMMLMNEGGVSDALISAETDVAEVIELHETKMEGDMMKMSPVTKVEIPAGGSTALKPGGLHVMLINLQEQLVPGEKIKLTLNFEKSDPLTIEAEVREMGAGMDNMNKKDMEHKEEGNK
jgi:copper(I)-binding protein